MAASHYLSSRVTLLVRVMDQMPGTAKKANEASLESCLDALVLARCGWSCWLCRDHSSEAFWGAADWPA
jgi:hypothetical protein